jgi:ParB-like chromosome segregation protein Spo0J
MQESAKVTTVNKPAPTAEIECDQDELLEQKKERIHPHKLPVFPATAVFPMMPEDELAELAADIKANRLRDPIVTAKIDGQVVLIDGRNRREACKRAGVEPRVADLGEMAADEATLYVISKNVLRRHLNQAQRSLIAAKLAKLQPGRPEKGQICPFTQPAIATRMQVSTRSVKHAAVVRDNGSPELIRAVEAGDMAISTAAEIATLPQPKQREIVSKSKREITKSARRSRAMKAARRQKKTMPPPSDGTKTTTAHDRDLASIRYAWSWIGKSAKREFLREITSDFPGAAALIDWFETTHPAEANCVAAIGDQP